MQHRKFNFLYDVFFCLALSSIRIISSWSKTKQKNNKIEFSNLILDLFWWRKRFIDDMFGLVPTNLIPLFRFTMGLKLILSLDKTTTCRVYWLLLPFSMTNDSYRPRMLLLMLVMQNFYFFSCNDMRVGISTDDTCEILWVTYLNK